MKWIDYVTKALENLGGRSPLSMIYEEVDLLRSKDSLDAKHLKEQVRRELETHSSSSKAYNPNYEDLFANFDKGKGIWELRNMFQKGKEYRRKALHEKYGGKLQSGISNCPDKPLIFIFSANTGKKYGYQDGWDDDKYFWYSGEGQTGDMEFKSGNKSLLDHGINGKRVYLFEKTKNIGFWKFKDELNLVDYDWYDINWEENGIQKTRKGIKFKFISVSHYNKIKLDPDLSKQKNNKEYNYSKPNKTERKGFVNTRIGQGHYRKQVLDKWYNKCGVTGVNIKEILIASHILSWSKSSHEQRLDPENGILLSPDIDALFDKYLISFDDSGNIIVPNKIKDSELEVLGIHKKMKLSHISEEMKYYLSKHRETFYEKND